MRTYTVTIPEQWRRAFGPTRQVEADYAIERDGALLFMQVTEVSGDKPGEIGYLHFLSGGDVKAAPQIMRNEFPAGFWSSCVPATCEWEEELELRQRAAESAS